MADTIKPDCTTVQTHASNEMQQDQYALFVIVYVSMTLNLMFLLLLVIKLVWTALQTCHVVRVTLPISTTSQQQISLLVADEVMNLFLILFTVYTCVTLCWPNDYIDVINKPPVTSLLCIVCINLGRYLFRCGIVIHCQFFHKGTIVRLIHHTMVILFLTATLVNRKTWWFAIIAVIMEMNNVIATMHRLMKLINNSHWKLVRGKFSIIEFIATIVFRMVLPMMLILLYALNKKVRTGLEFDVFSVLVLWVTCIFFSGFQFYQLYRRGLYVYRNFYKPDRDEAIKPEKRPVINSVQNVKFNMVSPLKEHMQIPGVKLVPNLENRIRLVRNDLSTAEKGDHGALLLNKTCNVNMDVSDKTSKNCNKALIGHCNQTCTDKTELLDEVKK